VGSVAERKRDVGQADVREVAAAPGGRLAQRRREQPVSFGRERGEQTPLVAEMVRRRGMGDPGPSRQVAKAHGRRPDLEHRLAQRIEEGAPQVSMVVSPTGSSH
jgi:hypothetical protein